MMMFCQPISWISTEHLLSDKKQSPRIPLASGVVFYADPLHIPLSHFRKLGRILGRKLTALEMRSVTRAIESYRAVREYYAKLPTLGERKKFLGSVEKHASALATILDTTTDVAKSSVGIDDLTVAAEEAPSVVYSGIKQRLGGHIDFDNIRLSLLALTELATASTERLSTFRAPRGTRDNPWRSDFIAEIHDILNEDISAGKTDEGTLWSGRSIDLLDLIFRMSGEELTHDQIGPYILRRR